MSIVVTKPRALGLSDAGRAFRDDVVAGQKNGRTHWKCPS